MRLVSTFSSTFERSAHGAIHLQIGGDMVITEKSSNDPLFWLHHANVDRYFYIWQTQHPNSRYNSKENIPESDALMFLNAPVSAGMARPDRSADFCYEYSSSVQAAQGPLRRRSEQGQAQHLKLKHPTPLPEAWLKRMKFDVAETRAFEAQERKFIDMLNEGNYAAPSALVEEQREHQGKVVFEPVKTHPWRFTSEQMEGLKQVWNAAEEPKE